MILLDTNVISEVMRPKPDTQVMQWLDAQNPELLYLCSPVLSELLLGIEFLPNGKRKDSLRTVLDFVRSKISNTVLSFDAQTAQVYAALVAHAQSTGYSVSVGDGQIAAIAKQQGYIVASRDTAPYAAMGLAYIDPWQKTQT